MQNGPRIPEIALRDRFIKRAAGQRFMFCVADGDTVATVPSQRISGRVVALFWSARVEAERWAPVLAKASVVEELPLLFVLAKVLPVLASQRILVGTDWGADPIEPEIEATDLSKRLRLEMTVNFVQQTVARRSVWLLEDRNGPATMPSSCGPGRLALPCWSDRRDAERLIDGPCRDKKAVEVPLENFLGLTLAWLSERGCRIAPEYAEGAGALEITPEEVKSRFRAHHAAA